MAGDVNHVAEAVGGEHAGPCTVIFQQSVGGSGRAVEDIIDLCGYNIYALTQRHNAGHDALGRVFHGGRQLVNRNPLRICVVIHQIRECAAYIDSNQIHAALHVVEFT